MNFRLVFRVTGKTLMVLSMTMLLPLLVCLIYRENPVPFLLAIAITGGVGLLLSLIRSDDHFFPREGFFAVALIWLLVGACGALPFYFCGQFASYIDCFFEAVSGFTTTGSSILTEVESLPHGILFWRSFMHFLGGMGVLVLTIALMPSLGGRTLHLMKAESPGPIVSKLVPKASQSSKILYGIYCGMTIVEIFVLRLVGMPWFDSVVNSFAIAGTGGFAIKNISIAAYGSPAIEIACTVFMLLFSVNFSVYFLILCGKIRQALRSDELRFFLIVVAASTVLISFNIYSMVGTAGDSVRHAAFQVASIISTTGFASTDFNLWPEFSKTILVLLMFIGACAGSTGGAIKCSRVLLLLRAIRREIRQIIHPRSVNVVKLDGRVVDEKDLRSTMIFFAAYMFITLAAILLVKPAESFLRHRFSLPRSGSQSRVRDQSPAEHHPVRLGKLPGKLFHILRREQVAVVADGKGRLQKSSVKLLPVGCTPVAFLLYSGMDDQLTQGIAAENLQQRAKFLRAFHSQPCLYGNLPVRPGAHLIQKPVQLLRTGQKSGSPLFGRHRAGRTSQIQVDFLITELL